MGIINPKFLLQNYKENLFKIKTMKMNMTHVYFIVPIHCDVYVCILHTYYLENNISVNSIHLRDEKGKGVKMGGMREG